MNTADLPVIVLRGTPYERGRIHGEALRQPIRRLHEVFRTQFAAVVRQDPKQSLAAGSFFREFLRSTRFVADIGRWAPDLLNEVRGIADGAQMPFEHVLELNLIDEIWAHAVRMKEPAAPRGCSAFGIAGQAGLPTWSGQNMDVPPWFEGFQVLLKIHQGDGRTVAFLYAFAGSVGINGMNSAALGMSCNTLAMLRSAPRGLPVLFVLRQFLEHRDFAAAISFLTAVPHASGQNYLVAAPGVVRSFECSARQVTEYLPDPAHTRVCHTNHPLASTDLDPDMRAPSGASTHARMASINARLGQAGKTITLDDVKHALAARDDPAFPVCCAGAAAQTELSYTLGSSIYELGATPRLHQAAGPPCTTDWKTFEF